MGHAHTGTEEYAQDTACEDVNSASNTKPPRAISHVLTKPSGSLLSSQPPHPISSLPNALHKSTVSSHTRLQKWYTHPNFQPSKDPWDIVRRFATTIEFNTTHRIWKWSSARTQYGHLLGALYRSHNLKAQIQPQDIRDYTKYLDLKVIEEEIDYSTPITKIDIHDAIAQLKARRQIQAACLLALMWSSTQRPHCTLHVQLRHVKPHPYLSDVLIMRFVVGKGVKMRKRPFVIFACTGQWTSMVLSLWRQRRRERTLFDLSKENKIRYQVKQVLRELDDTYDLRSVRRGALECLATTLMPEQIMHYSGHSNVQMTMRYLRWGETAFLQGDTMAAAAREVMH